MKKYFSSERDLLHKIEKIIQNVLNHKIETVISFYYELQRKIKLIGTNLIAIIFQLCMFNVSII